MPKSKNNKKNDENKKAEFLGKKIKCPICGKEKSLNQFYQSNNQKYVLFNNHCFICKKCLKDMCYSNNIEDKDGFKMVLEKYLDLPFIQDIYVQALNDNKETLGRYISLLNMKFKGKTVTYKDSDKPKQINNIKEKIINDNSDQEIHDEDKIKQLRLFWGNGFTYDEYTFLENELDSWKATHKYTDRADLILLKEICLQVLTVREKRENKEDASKALKDLQDLMKTASVDPAKTNSNDLNKSGEALGVWIKDIEQYRPGEWYDQQEKYKDMDGFITYIKNYIIRPIKNFISGSRDFKILTEKNIDEKDSDKK